MKKYSLNFDFPFKDLNGDAAKQNDAFVIVGKLIGDFLANSVGIPVDKIFKHWEWAKLLYASSSTDPGTFLQLDRSDFDYLRKIIQDDKNFSAAAKAQILVVFNEAEKVTDAPTQNKSESE